MSAFFPPSRSKARRSSRREIVRAAWVATRTKRDCLRTGNRPPARNRHLHRREAQAHVVENYRERAQSRLCQPCVPASRSILGSAALMRYIRKAYARERYAQPRAVLSEFDLHLPADVQIIVHRIATPTSRLSVLPTRHRKRQPMIEQQLAECFDARFAPRSALPLLSRQDRLSRAFPSDC